MSASPRRTEDLYITQDEARTLSQAFKDQADRLEIAIQQQWQARRNRSGWNAGVARQGLPGEGFWQRWSRLRCIQDAIYRFEDRLDLLYQMNFFVGAHDVVNIETQCEHGIHRKVVDALMAVRSGRLDGWITNEFKTCLP